MFVPIVLVSMAMETIPPLKNSNLKDKGFILAQVIVQTSKSKGERNLRQLVTEHPYSRAERTECLHA